MIERASTTSAVVPLLQTTQTIPIIFVGVIDPVGSGIIQSMARPGGNVTGFTLFEYAIAGKWLELLKELAPHGPRLADMFRRLGVYAGKILAGAKPADLPGEQPTNIPLKINLKAAKALGPAVPPTLLARADEVIE